MRLPTMAALAIWCALSTAAVAAPATGPAPTTAPATRPAGTVPVTPAVAATLYEERKLAAPVPGANERYRLLRPADVEPGRRYPLVVHLHGAGEKGDDNLKPLNASLPRLLATPAFRQRFPCVVLVPQCRAGNADDGPPNNWTRWAGMAQNKSPLWVDADPTPTNQLRSVAAAIDEVIKSEPIDPSRVYLTGVSMGGSGSWYLAGEIPDRIAAIAPVCGLSDVKRAGRLVAVPVWAFHGETDEQVPTQRTRDTVAALSKAGATPRYTEFAGVGHGGVDKLAWTEETLTWLFAQRKEQAKAP